MNTIHILTITSLALKQHKILVLTYVLTKLSIMISPVFRNLILEKHRKLLNSPEWYEMQIP